MSVVHGVERPLRRVAMVSVHTSPLDRPGTGDAGGMNVYVVELARRLARRGVEVDVFTRATSSELEPLVQAEDGVRVQHVTAGPFEGLDKADLPAQLCAFSREVLRTEASHEPGWYDAVHSHYWLSGQVGALARDRWGVPLVHSMHTMAKVKNAALADGDPPEPAVRVIGEEQVVAAADLLIANTDDEARELVEHYGAEPDRIEVVAPGVDLELFTATDRTAARARLGIAPDKHLLVFVGRIQPLKAPDILLRAAAEMLRRDPTLAGRLEVAVVGGPSGSGLERPTALVDLAADLGLGDAVRFVPPVERRELVDWYAAADAVCVPSYNESFGLVAAEAQAVGTPVVAAAVGGLPTVVRHEESGLLVPGHDPVDYAAALGRIVADLALRERLADGAVRSASRFSWDRTADRTLAAYRTAALRRREDLVPRA
ncbi:D-inositol-3-phosphate glycosyltransferase [Marmoricola endophyticus]|uniref:D-inositol-3-phosphate glycosyltransferase n=1 Tax=Marmoricola endophyticus TaxID=2040280 RepID=A0A917F5H6_9ACTN|nr:D-inositol-3-phosphate glycosyltransferase [Marmoricola endophyticus]GGF51906.1 D-inositol-3-phosphate glycosyltransferase [Marmoricola endophyticus]